MALIWTSNVATGVDWQDKHHKDLFTRINTFIDALARDTNKDDLVKLLGFLNIYVETHFAREESAMAQTKYSGSERHMMQHKKFIEALGALKEKIKGASDQRELCNEARRLLSDWFFEHVSKSDKALGAYLVTASTIGARVMPSMAP